MVIDYQSRAGMIGGGLKSVDLSNYGTALVDPATGDFVLHTAFENLMTAVYVAIIEEYSKNKMEVAIHPFAEKAVLPTQGVMAYNIGTSIAEGLSGQLTTDTYAFTNAVAGRYFFLTVYATEAFLFKTLTNCSIINNPAALVRLEAGTHTIMMKATLGAPTATSVLFDAIDDAGTPSGLAVVGHAITVWTPNQARAFK